VPTGYGSEIANQILIHRLMVVNSVVLNENPDQLEPFETKALSKIIAIGTMIAALYAVLVFLPISAFIGAGSILSAAIFIAPLFGILLGPRYGAIFGLIAGLIATVFSAQIGGLYLALPPIIFGPAISGFLTGLCLERTTTLGSLKIPGPMIAGFYLVLVVILYLIPNYSGWWFIIPYALAAVIAFGLQIFAVDITSTSKMKATTGIVLLAIIGTMTDFSMMTMASVYQLQLDAYTFGVVIFPIMLIERTAAVIISSIIIGVLLAAFKDELPIR